ncbi:unnamed protein product, partial [Hymenolepis diminuta]
MNLQMSEIPLNAGTCSGILSSDTRKSLLGSLLTLGEECDMKSISDDRFLQKPVKALLSFTSTEEKKDLFPGSNEESRPQSTPSDKRKSETVLDGLENSFGCLIKGPSLRYYNANKGDT